MPRFTPKSFLILALLGFVGISLILYNNVESHANQREAILSKVRFQKILFFDNFDEYFFRVNMKYQN